MEEVVSMKFVMPVRRSRTRGLVLVSFMLSSVLFACGYGKDTGPKHPRPQAQFNETVAKFTSRMKQCLPEAVQANLNRPITETEKADGKRVGTALSNFKTELTQCLTGEGYGNEVQLEASKVEAWLSKPDCATFVKAVFDAAECSALQMVLEDSGFAAKQ